VALWGRGWADYAHPRAADGVEQDSLHQPIMGRGYRGEDHDIAGFGIQSQEALEGAEKADPVPGCGTKRVPAASPGNHDVRESQDAQIFRCSVASVRERLLRPKNLR
jgi:hypothetical protein